MRFLVRVAALSLGLALLSQRAEAVQPIARPWTGQTVDAERVRYRSAVVRGIRIFYREAGDPAKPAMLLLHGFPASSHMFRELMPLLAKDFYLVAPDYPGAGFSDYPSAGTFTPTFANLADLMSEFVGQVGLSNILVYMQDFGGPVGFRMAVAHPEWIRGLIIQNANAYVEGIAPEQLAVIRSAAKGVTDEQRRQAEQLMSRAFTLVMYGTGVRDFNSIDPTGWNLGLWILANPEARRIQTELMLDYHSNVADYPRWQAFLRGHRPKLLVVWGRNDPVFLPAGATAYQRDLPGAQVRFLETGHFALEEDALVIAREILRTFAGPRAD